MCEDQEFLTSANAEVSKEEVDEANTLFKQPFAFYGGYAQLSANAKDQIIESKIINQLLQKISYLKEELRVKDDQLRLAYDIIENKGNMAGDSVKVINDLEDQLRKKDHFIKLEAKRQN